MAAMYHRSTLLAFPTARSARYYDVADIQSRLLRHQVLTAHNRNSFDNYSHSLCIRPFPHTGEPL